MSFNLLPSDNFTICTKDSISIAKQKLMEHVENTEMIHSIEKRNFRGIISEDTFKIYPVCRPDFYAPTVIGEFESRQNETLIHLHITLNFRQYTFLILIFILTIDSFKQLLETYLSQNITLILPWRVYLLNVLFAITIGVDLALYIHESKLAKVKLRQIFL